MFMLHVLLCFCMVLYSKFELKSSGLLHTHWGNNTTGIVPVKQLWVIMVNAWCEFPTKDITSTRKQTQQTYVHVSWDVLFIYNLHRDVLFIYNLHMVVIYSIISIDALVSVIPFTYNNQLNSIEIGARKSNYILTKSWNVITYPCHNLHGTLTK